MIDLDDIRRAGAAIEPYIYRTPLRGSFFFSETTGFDVYMKLENWQPTGSFKVRGALNVIHSFSPRDRLQGVVAWSAGNHGLGVAYGAGIYDIPATIFIPKTTPDAKIRKFKYFPVEVRMADTYEACEEEGRRYAEKEGALIVHPYDDWRTVAGQGTAGVEICEAMRELDAIVAPVGGGGLISGIAIAAKTMDPEIRMIAAQSAASPSLQRSLEEKHCYESFPVEYSIAEGVAGGIGKIVYDLAPRYIDEIINVEEDQIRIAIRKLIEHEQMIVEASGAVGLAALDQVECVPRGSRIAVVITGANLNMRLLHEILI